MKKTDKFKIIDFSVITGWFKTITNQVTMGLFSSETYANLICLNNISVQLMKILEVFTYYRGDILNLMERHSGVLEKK